MNKLESEGTSPFYPDRPVSVELFRGRKAEIDHILRRGVNQVAHGKPMTFFVEGEYGIGKSSIAALTQRLAERESGLHGIYASLGGANTLEDVAEKILAATVRSGALEPKRQEKIRNWLSSYIGEQSFFGVSLHLEALKKDAPRLSSADNLLDFLAQVLSRLNDTETKGIFLVLDEINGIAKNKAFPHFLKAFVDTNAISARPVPVLLMLCGVQQRRWDLIEQHEPVGRIFDIVSIERMSDDEMRVFYQDAFNTVGRVVTDEALDILTKFAAGFPKIMHIIGDAAFWQDDDGTIDATDAFKAVVKAAEDVGERYVDQQVYAALRSPDYHSILKKIALINLDRMDFSKSEIENGLSESEKRKFNNFLQKMKKLNVLRSGSERGVYLFNMRMVRLYIWLVSQEKSQPKGNE